MRLSLYAWRAEAEGNLWAMMDRLQREYLRDFHSDPGDAHTAAFNDRIQQEGECELKAISAAEMNDSMIQDRFASMLGISVADVQNFGIVERLLSLPFRMLAEFDLSINGEYIDDPNLSVADVPDWINDLGPSKAKRAISLAKFIKTNWHSDGAKRILQNLDMSVDEYISKYRASSIRNDIGSEYFDMTVEEALRSGNRKVKKLLTDNRKKFCK